MVSLRPLLVFSLLSLSGCAKVSYLWDQGWGQVSLLNSASPNAEVLKDSDVSQENKEKIKKIEELKAYFYQYWGRPATGIYSETTLLESKAVTHLVIASPYSEIKAIDNCFPFMGCFPYLGFFSKEKAHDHATELEGQNYETHVRPVYAYSTLGYFEDKILSSFFYFEDFALTEMIFHELFHTIFFAKDEVSLNEALANHFSRLMAFEYYNLSESEKKVRIDERAKNAALSATFASEVRLFNEFLKEKDVKDKETLEKLRQNYLEEVLFPRVKEFCARENLTNCFPLKRPWNNASMAAFMTYEDKGSRIEELQEKLDLDLKGYFNHIEAAYDQYKKLDIDPKTQKFGEWLFNNI